MTNCGNAPSGSVSNCGATLGGAKANLRINHSGQHVKPLSREDLLRLRASERPDRRDLAVSHANISLGHPSMGDTTAPAHQQIEFFRHSLPRGRSMPSNGIRRSPTDSAFLSAPEHLLTVGLAGISELPPFHAPGDRQGLTAHMARETGRT